MLKSVLLFLLVFPFTVMAEEVPVLSQKFPPSFSHYVYSFNFSTDPKTNEPSVYFAMYRFLPDGQLGSTIRYSLVKHIKIPGLVRMNNNLVLRSQERDVVCGTYYLSGIFRREKFRPSGNCEINSEHSWTEEGDYLIEAVIDLQ